MVVDFSGMKQVRVDPEKRIARAEAGMTLAEFDGATDKFGLATTMGTFQPTGIAGLTLGGGLGWLMGKYGLSCDNLVAAELVTADGRVISADANENEDLLWGLRGGGGNFGAVTSFSYSLHSVKHVLAGVLKYAPTQLGEVLRFFRDYSATAPDEVNMICGILPLAEPGVGIAVSYCGDLDEGKAVQRPLRSFSRPLSDTIKPITS
jgi:FAD/FMN-containing dehydrogenase